LWLGNTFSAFFGLKLKHASPELIMAETGLRCWHVGCRGYDDDEFIVCNEMTSFVER